MSTDYELLVIGSGPAGQKAAIQGAKLGRRVALVERRELGGVSVNWGTTVLVSGDEERRVSADRVIIATGTRPAHPPEVNSMTERSSTPTACCTSAGSRNPLSLSGSRHTRTACAT